MSPDTLAALLRVQQEGGEAVLATRLGDGAQFLLPDTNAPSVLQDAGRVALARERTGIVVVGDERWFLHVHGRAPRVLVVGAVHIAQALARIAAIIGLAVTVIDPRGGFATEERFGGVGLVHDWPDEAIRALKPDRRTALVALTHDPKLDDPALDAALRSDAFFIGALGSRKSHARRLERLAALGHSRADLGRISGPVGLDIGAVSPAEIALSILAEIVATRRRVGSEAV